MQGARFIFGNGPGFGCRKRLLEDGRFGWRIGKRFGQGQGLGTLSVRSLMMCDQESDSAKVTQKSQFSTGVLVRACKKDRGRVRERGERPLRASSAWRISRVDKRLVQVLGAGNGGESGRPGSRRSFKWK